MHTRAPNEFSGDSRNIEPCIAVALDDSDGDARLTRHERAAQRAVWRTINFYRIPSCGGENIHGFNSQPERKLRAFQHRRKHAVRVAAYAFRIGNPARCGQPCQVVMLRNLDVVYDVAHTHACRFEQVFRVVSQER